MATAISKVKRVHDVNIPDSVHRTTIIFKSRFVTV